MFLQALHAYSYRLDDLGPAMYKRVPVRYEVQLDLDGNPLGLVTLSGGEGKRGERGLEMFAPALVRSGTGAKPILLADRGDYALGWGEDTTAERNHTAFSALVLECAEVTDDPAVWAVARFLERPADERPALPPDADPRATVTFTVNDRRPIDSAAVQAFWAARADRSAAKGGSAANEMQCIVCGQQRPALPRLPYMIKGLSPVGGQSSGTALISANVNVFESYGLKNNFIAPTCADCGERVCKALNALIEDRATRLYLGRVLYVHWTREDDGISLLNLLDVADPEEVRDFLRAAQTADATATGIDASAFYCLGLSGSGARVAVRDWIDTTIGQARRHLARYFLLQRIVARDGIEMRHYGIRALAGATVREGSTDDPAPDVPLALMRLALRGGALPSGLIAQVIRRIRAGQAVTPQQAMLIKMVLASQRTEGWESYMVELDEQNSDPAYLCGRLLAVLDSIQRAALGERNATIIDRFFGSASTAPVAVFGRLVKGAQPHLARLRRDRPGTGFALEARMTEIMSQIDTFPRTLTLREQGMFVLGYYHQRAADTKARIEHSTARREAAETATVTTLEDEG